MITLTRAGLDTVTASVIIVILVVTCAVAIYLFVSNTVQGATSIKLSGPIIVTYAEYVESKKPSLVLVMRLPSEIDSASLRSSLSFLICSNIEGEIALAQEVKPSTVSISPEGLSTTFKVTIPLEEPLKPGTYQCMISLSSAETVTTPMFTVTGSSAQSKATQETTQQKTKTTTQQKAKTTTRTSKKTKITHRRTRSVRLSFSRLFRLFIFYILPWLYRLIFPLMLFIM